MMTTPTRFALVLSVLLGGFFSQAADGPPSVQATLKGHKDQVFAVAFSPNGKVVVTGSLDRTIKLWDAATGKEIKTLAGHNEQVLAVAVNPSSQLLASGSSDRTVKLWTMPSDDPTRIFAHADEVNALAISPDGKLLAGAGKDSIIIWNPADGKQITQLKGHTGPVRGLAFNATSKVLASTGADGTLRFWEPASGKLLATRLSSESPGNSVAWDAGKTAFTAGDDGTIKLWPFPPPAARKLPDHGEAVTALALSADGQQVISASADKTVRICTFAKGEQVRHLTGPAGAVNAVALAPDGKTAAAGTADNRLFVWNAADGKVLSQDAAHTGPVTGVAFHPQGKQILTSGKDGMVKLWTWPPVPEQQPEPKPEDRAVTAIKAHEGGVTGASFDQNGSQALTGGADKTVKLWDLATSKEVRSWTMAEPVAAVAFSRDFAQVGAAAGKTVKIWNRADGKDLLSLDHPAPVLSLAFSFDKTKLVTGAADNRCRVWDLKTGKLMEAFGRRGAIQAVVLHPDNQSIITGSADKTVRVQPLAVTRLTVASKTPVRSLVFVPEGNRLLSAADDGSVKLWNLGNGTSESGAASAPRAALAKNGLLVAAGSGQTVRISTLYNGKERAALKTPAPIRSLAFSPNNQMLAAACADGTILTWDVNYVRGQPQPANFGKVLRTFKHAAPATDLAWAADSGTLFSSSLDKTIKAWQLAGSGPGKNIGHPDLVHAVAFDPTGTRLATGCKDGNLRIIDVAKAQVIKQIAAHNKPQPAPIYGVAWTPDGKQVATASYDHSLKLWDPASGNLVREFKAHNPKDCPLGHRRAVYALAFSPDGQFLASAGDDRTLKLWSVAEGKVVREFVNPKWPSPAAPMAEPGKPAPPPAQPPQAHPSWIYGLRFTPDGKYLISAGSAPGYHGYLAIWNAGDGTLVHSQDLPTGAINSLALSPDAKSLAIACGPTARRDPTSHAFMLKMPELAK